MKMKPILALLSIPTLAVGYGLFHPGVTYAETTLAQASQTIKLEQPGTFTVDPAHTFIGFDIGHLGLSRVQGRFPKMAGTLQIDPKNLDKSSVMVTAQIDSVDTAVAQRDTHLKTPDFFDATKYPEMMFRSTKISKRGKGYVAEGTLTLKGVTRSLSIPFKQYGPIKDPWGGTRIGIVADPVTIRRSDFGITHDLDSVSDDVNLKLSMEATLDKPATATK